MFTVQPLFIPDTPDRQSPDPYSFSAPSPYRYSPPLSDHGYEAGTGSGNIRSPSMPPLADGSDSELEAVSRAASPMQVGPPRAPSIEIDEHAAFGDDIAPMSDADISSHFSVITAPATSTLWACPTSIHISATSAAAGAKALLYILERAHGAPSEPLPEGVLTCPAVAIQPVLFLKTDKVIVM